MTVILRGVVGSTAYGLATPESDIDMIGTYVAPTRQVLGFGIPTGAQTRVTNKPDTTTHEIGKYVGLALKCNPTILELMWLWDYDVRSPIGAELIGLRAKFLSKGRIRDAYCGYAIQQAKRLVRREEAGKAGFGDVPTNRTAKHGRHCFRLLTQCETLLRYGRLSVRLTPSQVEMVRDMGDWAAKSPEAFSEAMYAQARTIEDIDSPLPDHPDVERIEDWLVSVRRRFDE